MSFSKESALERLTAAHRNGRLAHAYLLSGPAGSGKNWLAERVAALVLGCEPEKVLTHPDAHFVQPESKSRRIVIDQIRSLEQTIQRKPLLGSAKVVIIHEADRLQPQAANAFLKTLEEPPPGSLIFLLSNLPEAILETILSRCVETPLHGTPGAAATESPVRAAIQRALEDSLVRPQTPSVADAFRLTRAVQACLAERREEIGSAFEDTLKKEVARYKQTSEGGAWLDERADQVKALTESAALREREQILQIIEDTLGEALRMSYGTPSAQPVARALAEKYPSRALLDHLEALTGLRRRLSLGVQEALALESGFLDLVCGGHR